MSRVQVYAISADGYKPHAVHGEGVAWVEKNCYVDVWIEAIHARGLEPLAMLPFVFRVDFEGDQWTFFKPPHEDITALYGMEVEELNVWQSLIRHAQNHLAQGNLIFTESDAYFLPDTQATDYRKTHTKSTIVLNDLDVEARRLGYFHNAGYYELSGEDFARTFQLDVPRAPEFMPFYAEFVRMNRVHVLPPAQLVPISTVLLRKHLARRPAQNPFRRFAPHFKTDVEWLKTEPINIYHGYAFALIRQIGAAFELGAQYLHWLTLNGEPGLEQAEQHCLGISNGAKALILKTARAVNAKKDVDFSPIMNEMAAHWDAAMEVLSTRYPA